MIKTNEQLFKQWFLDEPILPLKVAAIGAMEEAANQASQFQQPAVPEQGEVVKDLKEVLKDFEWTHDNMGIPHTSDHFNIPVNAIESLKRIIELLSTTPPQGQEQDKWVKDLRSALHGLIYGHKMNIQFDTPEDQHKYNAALRLAKQALK